MNLHQIVAGAVSPLCPTTIVKWLKSTGYFQDPVTKKTTPTFKTVNILAQVQPLSSSKIQHPGGLNIQGYQKELWIDAQAWGACRDLLKGGDKFIFENATWIVDAILEDWNSSGWSHIIVRRLQDGTQHPN